jgi:hypothetical protein
MLVWKVWRVILRYLLFGTAFIVQHGRQHSWFSSLRGVSAPNLVWRQKGRGYTSDIVAACSLIFGEVGILCPGSRSVCKCDIDLCDGLHWLLFRFYEFIQFFPVTNFSRDKFEVFCEYKLCSICSNQKSKSNLVFSSQILQVWWWWIEPPFALPPNKNILTLCGQRRTMAYSILLVN